VTALLLDTNSLFFRAHHALPPMNTSTDEPTAALYGFSALVIKLLREVRPSGMAFARDLPQPTFRHVQYRDYKAGRPPVPDALRPQWGRLDDLIAAFGVPSHSAPGFEADDVLATLARRLTMSEAPEDVTIVSGDRDLFQTIGPHVRVLFVGARGQKPETVDAAVVEARYGIVPTRMPMWSALVGESADNLVGVPGIGTRTASKLAARYETTANLLAHLDSVTPLKVRDALRAASDRLTMNEGLARLRDDLDMTTTPLVGSVDDAALARVQNVFEALEFKSLVGRLNALRTASS
jgi:DNA polymerase-1